MNEDESRDLMADEAGVPELVREPSSGEATPVPQAADYALVAEEVMAAIRELHARGGIDDVFGRLPDEQDSDAD